MARKSGWPSRARSRPINGASSSTPRLHRAGFVLILGLSALIGVVSVGDSGILPSPSPSTRGSHTPTLANPANGAQDTTSVMRTAAIAAQHPAPIHGNVWTSAEPVPPEGYTSFSHWITDSSGLVTQQFYLAPRFRNVSGSWQTIDPSVSAQVDPNFPLASLGTIRPIHFGATASSLFRIDLDGGSVSMSTPDLHIATPGLQGRQVVFSSVARDTTLSYETSGSGLREKLTLLSAAAPTSFHFHLSDPHKILGAMHDDGNGGVFFDKVIDGDLHLSLPRQYAYEASLDNSPLGPLVDPSSASMVIVPGGDGFDVTVSVSSTWLTHHQYPIVLDPTVGFTQAAGNLVMGWDGHVGSANCSAGPDACSISTASDLGLGADSDGSPYSWEPARTYARFDLTAIPAGAQINSATLNLNLVGPLGNSNDSDENGYQAAFNVEMHELTKPVITTGNYSQLVAATASTPFMTFSLGAYTHLHTCECVIQGFSIPSGEISKWVNNPAGNDGMSIQMDAQSESNPTIGGSAWTDTGPYGQQYGNLPNLQVTYTRPDYGAVNWGFQNDAQNPPQFPQNGNPSFLGPAVSTPTSTWVYVVNQGSQKWPANGNYKVSYHIRDGTDANELLRDGTRTYFTNDVVPGTGLWVNANIQAMSSLGLGENSYVLRWDMVNENVTWFSTPGAATADFHVLVAAPPAPSAPANGSTLTSAAAPTLTAGTCGTSNSASLCGTYLFQLSTDPNFGGYITSSGWRSSPSWQPPASALQQGTNYYWRVIGRDQYFASTSWSSRWSFTTAGTPAAPGTVTVGQTPTSSRAAPNAGTCVSCPVSVNVSWIPPPTDGGSIVTSYDVTPYLNWDPQPSVSVAAPATSVTLNGLVGGGNYAFTVTAVNSIGAGVPSNFSASIVPSGVPGAPSTVTAQGGDNQVQVFWAPPPDGATDVTAYQVNTYLAASPPGAVPAFTTTVAATATSVVLTQGIVNGVAYTFGVASVNSSGGFDLSPLTSPIVYSADNTTGGSTTPTPSPTVSLSLNASQYARGKSAALTAVIHPTSGNSESGDTLTLTLPSGFDGSGSTVGVAGQPCGSQGTACTITSSKISVTGITVPAGGVTVNATVRALGTDSYCTSQTITAVAANTAQAGGNGSVSASVCDGGIGNQPWWSFVNANTGPGGAAQVNVADGNLVSSQTDSTVFQLHGHLKLGTARTYNSEEIANPGSELLGRGWSVSWVSAGDRLGGTALRISADEHVTQGQAVTLIDDTGARVVFTPNDLQAPIDVTGLGATTGPLAPLLPTKLAVPSGSGHRLCVSTAYTSEAGVHASMWRYVQSNTGACTGLNATNAAVLGYATMTVDRVRREFNASGQLLSVRDALGNRVDYLYDSSGRLASVGETSGSLRAFNLSYGTWSSGIEIDVTDPAGRQPTKYQLDKADLTGHLVNVINPDATTFHYTYGGCGGGVDQLCSVSDPRGSVTSFQYAAAPSWVAPGSPAQVSQFTDRSGTTTKFAYLAASETALDTGTERQLYWNIDGAGRAAVHGEGPNTSAWLRVTVSAWDTAAAPCRQPDVAVDNDLCWIRRLELNHGITPDRLTSYTYDDEGGILSEKKVLTPSNSIATTSDYWAGYVEADGTVRSFHDAIAGGGQVTSGSAGRRDNKTVFYYSDLAGELNPNGNTVGSGYISWETLYTIDRGSGVGAGIPIASAAMPVCQGGHANTGLVCQINAPAMDRNGNRSLTTYTYDTYGQRTSMATPDMNLPIDQPGAQPNAQPISYIYFQDGDRDLSGHTQAGGWLRIVIDPGGGFVAFGYDAAGNVVRTWERNATAGHAWTQFPGAVGAPPNSAYTETLYASGTAAYSAPWRFAVSSRDALGNVTTFQRDANGKALGVRPPRGNQGGPAAAPNCPSVGSFDVCSTYDASDRLLTVQQPFEANQNPNWHTTNTYDQYGNLASTKDPDSNVTTYAYDSVNRQVLMNWTMGPTGGAMQTPPGCRASTSTDAPIPANRIVCSKTTIYDGVDNVTAATDGAVANDGTGSTVYTIYRYDAVHRLIQTYTPRYDGTFRMLESDTVYDADGNATDICPPRQFIEGKQGCTYPNDYFSTHRSYLPNDMLNTSSSYLGYSPTSATPVGIAYWYDADGNRITMTDSNGHMTCNIYDALDRLITTLVPRNPANSCDSNYPYPSDGYNPTNYTYDPSGNRILTSQETTAGTRNTLVSYDADNRPVDTVLAAMTSAGQPATDISQVGTTDSSGGSNIHTRVSYDADGHAVARFSPRAFAGSATSPSAEFMVRTDYDGDGRPTAQYVPRYDTADQAVGALGVSTVFSGQADQSSQCPTGASPQAVARVPGFPSTTGVCITAVQYDPAGRVTKQLTPTAAGNWASPSFDAFSYTDNGLLFEKAIPQPSLNADGGDASYPHVATTMQYDVEGNLLSSTDPLGLLTTYTWSRDHMLLAVQRPPGPGLLHSQSATYDGNGNQTGIADVYGATTITSYTTNNLKQSVATPAGGATPSPGVFDNQPYVTSYTYDPVGNLLSTISPNANADDADNPGKKPTTYSYTYDNLLATTMLPPGSGGSQREIDNAYDAAGQRTSQHTYQQGAGASGDGGTLAYQYYRDGRLQQDTARDGTTLKTFTYDADGNTISWAGAAASYYIDGALRTVDDGTYTAQWSYDGGGQMATLTEARNGGGQTPATEAAKYNHAGLLWLLATNQYNSGAAEVRTHDNDGRLATIQQSNGNVQTYAYNTDSTLASVALNQSGSGGNQLASWSYLYDGDYRVVAAAESAPNYVAAAFTYAYYPDGRLAEYALTNQGSGGYVIYDHDGNRTGWTPPLTTVGSVLSTYNADDTLIQSINSNGTMGMAYDADGRLTSDGCTSYTYDGFDRMHSATVFQNGRNVPLCGPVPTSTVSDYAYDGLDRQWQRIDANGWWWDHYSDLGKTIGLISVPATGAGEQDLVLTTDQAGTASMVSSVQTGAAQWFTSDGRGNVGAVTKADTSMACVLTYDFYGASMFGQTSTSSNPCVGSGSQLTELGYQFSHRDATTGDYTFGARTYDPAKAAFTTPDAFQPGSTRLDVSMGSDPLTADRYAYVNGDPVNRIDPTGHHYDTGNDFADAQGSATCAVCFTQPTQYITRTSHGATCDATCRQSAAQARTAAVAHDQAVANGPELKPGAIGGTIGPFADPTSGMENPPPNGFASWDAFTATQVAEGDAQAAAYCSSTDRPSNRICDPNAIVLPGDRPQDIMQGMLFAVPVFGEAAYARAVAEAATDEGDSLLGRLASSCARNSFTAGTLVVMADGTTKAISQVRLGDKVEATDPATGNTAAATVSHLFLNDDHNLADVVIRKSPGATVTLRSTQGHRVWDQTLGAWVFASQLRAGDALLSDDGTSAVVEAVHLWQGSAWMYDLTVDGVHTFYVLTGAVSVLVHNCAVDANKLDHIFGNPEHGLGEVVQNLGGEQQALDAAQASLQGADIPSDGLFEVTRTIGGQSVTIRGAVVNGIPRVGTMFTTP
jgi:RHS repeat-associated protein